MRNRARLSCVDRSPPVHRFVAGCADYAHRLLGFVPVRAADYAHLGRIAQVAADHAYAFDLSDAAAPCPPPIMRGQHRLCPQSESIPRATVRRRQAEHRIGRDTRACTAPPPLRIRPAR